MATPASTPSSPFSFYTPLWLDAKISGSNERWSVGGRSKKARTATASRRLKPAVRAIDLKRVACSTPALASPHAFCTHLLNTSNAAHGAETARRQAAETELAFALTRLREQEDRLDVLCFESCALREECKIAGRVEEQLHRWWIDAQAEVKAVREELARLRGESTEALQRFLDTVVFQAYLLDELRAANKAMLNDARTTRDREEAERTSALQAKEQLRQQLRDTKVALRASIYNVRAAREHTQKTQDELALTRDERDGALQQFEVSKAALRAMENQLKAEKESRATIEARFAKEEESVAMLRGELVALRDEHYEDAEEWLSKFDALHAEKAGLEERIEQVNTELQRLHADKDALDAELCTQRESFAALQDQLSAAKDAKEAVQILFDEERSTYQRLAASEAAARKDLEEQLSGLRAQLSVIQSQLRAESSAREKLEMTKNTLEATVRKLEANKNGIETVLNDHRVLLTTRAASITTLQEEVVALRVEQDNVRRALASSMDDAKEQLAVLDKLRMEKARVDDCLETMRIDKEHTEAEVWQLRAENANLEKRNERLRHDKLRTDAEVKRIHGAYNSTLTDLMRLRDDYDAANAELNIQRAAVESLGHTLSAERATAKAVEADLHHERATRVDLEQQLVSERAHSRTLRAQLDTESSARKGLQISYDTMHKDLAMQSMSVAALRTEASILRAERDKNLLDAKEQVILIDKLRADKDELEGRIQRMGFDADRQLYWLCKEGGVADELQRLRSDKQSAEDELQQLRMDKMYADADLLFLQVKVEELRSEKDSADAELHLLRLEMHQLRLDKQSADTALHLLRLKVQELEAKSKREQDEHDAFARMSGRWNARDEQRRAQAAAHGSGSGQSPFGSSSWSPPRPRAPPRPRTPPPPPTPSPSLSPLEVYEYHWSAMQTSTADTVPWRFSFANFPWPTLTPEVINEMEILRFLGLDREPDTTKTHQVVRRQLARWHPDKFVQRGALDFVLVRDRDAVLLRQREVTLCLTDILGKL